MILPNELREKMKKLVHSAMWADEEDLALHAAEIALAWAMEEVCRWCGAPVGADGEHPIIQEGPVCAIEGSRAVEGAVVARAEWRRKEER